MMFKTLAVWFLSGVLGGNAIPHMIKGMTKERYPCALGNGPLPNLIGGWSCFVLAITLIRWVSGSAISGLGLAAFAVGILGIELFHAVVGAIGKP